MNTNTPITDAELEEWLAECDEATPGPWEAYESHGAYVKEPGFAELGIQQSHGARTTVALVISDITLLQGGRFNAPFMANSRTNHPRVIRELQKARGVLESAKRVILQSPEAPYRLEMLYEIANVLPPKGGD